MRVRLPWLVVVSALACSPADDAPRPADHRGDPSEHAEHAEHAEHEASPAPSGAAAAPRGRPQAASSVRLGDLAIEGAFAPHPPNDVAAVYATLRNHGERDDRLVAVRTGEAADAQLHRTVKEDGVARMRPVEDGIVVPAGGSALLQPGGAHIMLMGLAARPAVGDHVTATLVFEHAGEVRIEAPVIATGRGHH